MDIKIKGIGFTVRPELTDFVNKKVVKLSQFYDKIIGSDVSLSTEKSGTKENKLCDIRLIIPGNDLLASAQCKTFEEAVDQSVEVLVKQIEKKKYKHINYETAKMIQILNY
ncbi:MAG: ribosome-associated translation inhibitor RaiA [Ferruginibacter sp.]